MKKHARFNRTFRLVWSVTHQCWQAVAETARRGKPGRAKLALSVTALAGLLASNAGMAQTAPAPTQLPTGAQVKAGTVKIQTPTPDNKLVVQQTTQRGVVQWDQFNVGSQARVDFQLPNRDAAILNKVLDMNASQIMGRITANGQVFISNPNGVVFGPSAQVDVGGLVATTYQANETAFMAGRAEFSGEGAGKVLNQGQLRSLQAGYIALLAPEVRNEGMVLAQVGTAAMAAGETITLNIQNGSLAGLTTTPAKLKALIENKKAVAAPNGMIILSARAANELAGGVINQQGETVAETLVSAGGRIFLEANQVNLSGTTVAGGRVRGSTLSADQMGNIDPRATEVASGELRIKADKLTTSDTAQVFARRLNVDTRDLAGVNGVTLSTIAPDVVGLWSADLVRTIAVSNAKALKPEQLSALSVAAAAALSTDQLSQLSGPQAVALTEVQRSGMSSAQLAALSAIANSTPAPLTPGLGFLMNLDKASYAAISVDAVKRITPETLRGLSAGKVAAFNETQLGALSLKQVVALRPAQKNNLSATQLAVLDQILAGLPSGSKQPNPYTLSVLSAMSNEALAALSADAISRIGPDVIRALSADKFAAFTPTQLAAFNGKQVSALTPAQIAGLTADHLKAMKAELVRAWTIDQVSALSAAQKNGLTNEQVQALLANPAPAVQAAALSGLSLERLKLVLTNSALQKLAPQAFKSLSNEFLAQLTVDQVRLLRSEQIAGLTVEQQAVWQSAQVQALSIDQLRQLSVVQLTAWASLMTEAQVAALPTLTEKVDAQYLNKLSLDKLKTIPPEKLAKLGVKAIRGLKADRVAAMTQDQLASMSNEQYGAMSTEQTSALTQSQNSDGTTLNRLSDQQLQSLDPQKFAAMGKRAMRGLSEAKLQKLSRQEVDSLSNEQLGSLSTSQINALSTNTAFDSGELNRLSTNQIKGLDGKQLAKMGERAVKGVRSDVLKNLSSSQLANLDVAQIKTLSFDQVSVLDTVQTSAIAQQAAQGLSGEMLARLRPEQREMIKRAASAGKNSDMTKAAAPTGPAPVVMR